MKTTVLGSFLIIFILGYMYADSATNVPPELKLQKEDFTYDNYKGGLKFIRGIVNKYRKGNKYDPNLDTNYIGIPNNLLRLEGYGLFTQKDLLQIKLEDIKLKGAKKEEITELEKDLRNIEKQIDIFLEKNHWLD